ncbi:hypothetical protein Tco_1348402, partial [Tanacetum coccineum]
GTRPTSNSVLFKEEDILSLTRIKPVTKINRKHGGVLLSTIQFFLSVGTGKPCSLQECSMKESVCFYYGAMRMKKDNRRSKNDGHVQASAYQRKKGTPVK